MLKLIRVSISKVWRLLLQKMILPVPVCGDTLEIAFLFLASPKNLSMVFRPVHFSIFCCHEICDLSAFRFSSILLCTTSFYKLYLPPYDNINHFTNRNSRAWVLVSFEWFHNFNIMASVQGILRILWTTFRRLQVCIKPLRRVIVLTKRSTRLVFV